LFFWRGQRLDHGLSRERLLQGDQIGRIFANTLGDCLLWVVFVEITEVAQIIGLLFTRLNVFINFHKNGFGNFFGHFLQKRIRSPRTRQRRKICDCVILINRRVGD
jgi:hypothetical protein